MADMCMMTQATCEHELAQVAAGGSLFIGGEGGLEDGGRASAATGCFANKPLGAARGLHGC